ncbi:hypothetical protein DL96DRAFT_1053131 [Flagelloscypha sp. PMI_526]|nr:hypothetical protein DL96DRAFT_1053131 [Flagelloscypha sp. PMI_526]
METSVVINTLLRTSSNLLCLVSLALPGREKVAVVKIPRVQTLLSSQDETPDPELIRRQAQIARNEAEETLQIAVRGFTVISLASGLRVQGALAGFDACRIVVNNLPPSATRTQICELFTQQGLELSQIFVSNLRVLSAGTQEASLICHKDCELVAIGLDGIEFGVNTLSFKVEAISHPRTMKASIRTPGELSTLTLHWSLPSFSAVGSFGDRAEADRTVLRMNKSICGRRRVRARLNMGRHSLPNEVLVQDIHPDTNDETVRAFFGPSLTHYRRLRIFEHHNPHDVPGILRSFLSDIAEIEPLSLAEELDGRATLRIRFTSPDACHRAKKLLEGPQLCIGNGKFSLWTPDGVRYSIVLPRRQYDVQTNQWHTLLASTKAKVGVNMTLKELTDAWRIVLGGHDKKAIGAVKVQVECLAAGTKIAVWHPWFFERESQPFFDEASRTFRALITRDWRRRMLYAYGAAENVENALRCIRDEVERRDSLRKVVHLKRKSLPYFRRQGLAALKEVLGEDDVVLDLRAGTIAVPDSDAAHHILDRVIRESLDDLASIRDHSDDPCPICYGEPGAPITLGCGHTYCTACLQHFLVTASQREQFPLLCIGNEDTCETPLPIPTIRRHLTIKQWDALLEAVFDHHVATRPTEFQYCPTPDCPQVYRCTARGEVVTITCPSCSIEICSSCHAEGHDGMTCDERRLQYDPVAQEQATNDLARQSGFKQCPLCQVWIEKTEGCNHMACRCGAHICWLCMKTFTRDEIYRHLANVHGGPFGNLNVDQFADYGNLGQQVAALQQAEQARARAAPPLPARPARYGVNEFEHQVAELYYRQGVRTQVPPPPPRAQLNNFYAITQARRLEEAERARRNEGRGRWCTIM